jgi:dolichyl-phosphate beta-glucosyltransferase
MIPLLPLLLLPLLILVAAYTALVLLSPTPLTHTFAETQYTSADHPPANKGQLKSLRDHPPECALTVVVPAFNERERLPDMVDEAMRFLVDSIKAAEEAATTANKSDEEQQWWKGGVEVLVVDDGSTDDTVHVAESLASSWEKEGKPVGVEIRVVKLERNRGKGGAVRHVSKSPRP